MIDAEEIKGIKGAAAFHTAQVLLLSYYMIPTFREGKETYLEFLDRFSKMDDEEKQKVFKIGATFADLKPNEVEAVLCFAKDKNGVPYGKCNIGTLGINEFYELISEICLAVVNIKLFF